MFKRAIEFVRSRRALILEAVRFASVGGASTGVYAVVMVVLVRFLDWNIAVATVPSYLVSMVMNYTLQKLWTFKSDARHATAIPKYLFVHLVGIGINYGAVVAAINALHAPYWMGQVGGVALIAVWSYAAQKYWAFATRRRLAS